MAITATAPTLRATSPSRRGFGKTPIKAGWRQSRPRGGARGTEKGRRIAATTPTLRATSPQGKASRTLIEGRCRQSTTDGVIEEQKKGDQ